MDRQGLIEAVARGGRPTFRFFWGHRPKRPGVVDTSCFSQWYGSPFEVEGLRYPTAEHFMMAGKARLFGDEEHLTAILAAGSPGAAKALGRAVRGFDEAVWQRERFGLVVRGNLVKFGQDAALLAVLRRTGTKVLVEASPTDRVWGIGLAADDPRSKDPRRWRGENLLGFALMRVRDQLG